MRADLAARALVPAPAVEPANAVDPRAAKPPMTRATSAMLAKRAVLPDPLPTRRLTVTTVASLRDSLGFSRLGRGRPAYSSPHTGHKPSAPMPVARAWMVVREARAPLSRQALAEGLLLVPAAEGAALFQDRQHVLDEVGRRAGLNERRDQESVEVGPLDERAQLVGDILGRTDDGVRADAVAMPRSQDIADGLALEALDLRLAHLRVQLLHRGGGVVGREVETREPGVGRDRDLRCLRLENLLVIQLGRFPRRR